MVPGYQGEGGWPCFLAPLLVEQSQLQGPCHTREQLPMGVYIPWEETYALYTPYSILREDTAKRLGQVTSSLCLSCFVRTTGQ